MTTRRGALAASLLLGLGSAAPSPARALPCDDACFLIQNTFAEETLRRYLDAFPSSPYAELARSRRTYLEGLRTHPGTGAADAFGPVHLAPSRVYRPAQVPAGTAGGAAGRP